MKLLFVTLFFGIASAQYVRVWTGDGTSPHGCLFGEAFMERENKCIPLLEMGGSTDNRASSADEYVRNVWLFDEIYDRFTRPTLKEPVKKGALHADGKPMIQHTGRWCYDRRYEPPRKFPCYFEAVRG